MGYGPKIPANQLRKSNKVCPMREYALYLPVVCVRRESTVVLFNRLYTTLSHIRTQNDPIMLFHEGDVELSTANTVYCYWLPWLLPVQIHVVVLPIISFAYHQLFWPCASFTCIYLQWFLSIVCSTSTSFCGVGVPPQWFPTCEIQRCFLHSFANDRKFPQYRVSKLTIGHTIPLDDQWYVRQQWTPECLDIQVHTCWVDCSARVPSRYHHLVWLFLAASITSKYPH